MNNARNQPRSTNRRVFLSIGGGVVLAALAFVAWATFAPEKFWSMFTPAYAGSQLSVTEAYQQAIAGDIVLIDIRRPDEWQRTGIGQGARPLDMRRRDFIETLTAMVGGDLDAPIALICARGVRSAGMSKRLAQAGFTRIFDVPEGMLGSRAGPGWLAGRLPVRAYDGASQ